MYQVLSGFTVVWVIILAGYLVGRTGVLGPHGQPVLSRVAFFVASPALLFDTLAASDVRSVLGPQLWVATASALLAAGLYLLLARFIVARRTASENVIGALNASMVNSANLGLPIAAYVLGNAALAAPVLIFQLALYTPAYIAALDTFTQREARQAGAEKPRVRPRSRFVRFLRAAGHTALNPMIVGSVLGLVFAATGWPLPGPVAESIHLIGGAAIPSMLLAFGITLVGSRPLEKAAGRRRDVALASAIKLVIHPALAWVIAGPLLGLGGDELFTAVVLASLPTAQNVFVAASRYETGMVAAKDTVLITTIIAIPAMIALAVLLA